MRSGLLLFLVCVTTAAAQQQERSLVDRLLKPDMTLGNPEQNKQFKASTALKAHSASARSFYVADRNLAKSFAGTRQFATGSFETRNFVTRPATVRRAQPVPEFPTKAARSSSVSPAAQKQYATRDFAGTRPFLARGKSQKALHAYDHPLTIEQVRELLNKNK